MKKFYAPLALLAFGTQLISCGSGTEVDADHGKPTFDELKKAEWFLGRWENKSDQGDLSETWTRESNSSFRGASYFVIAGDTVFEEQILLQEVDGKLIYSPTIADQNNGKPIDFTMTRSGKNELVFENKQHDFPQKITYTLRNDSLVAVISGKRDGKQQSEVFAMAKGH
jgi:hypothetical protein